ncbi:UDP-2,4-diacetamido-2,4,6-trideoxy-beta-L-altropyranose hydrolase [Terasakiella sp. A23]|uniref:UDP-2,4-diacetamido-2,4, 6-trideoxy-beta-L-altropyranose hydrolase n=1 Tax=Terasakiella sp. FCG-A23 TaxID=3080561 RepID=UPI002952B338|nr:UDP-2,4-diacetamido-2,4,6-trideoxy-beta-L-altropyranose hydrolase [Terasakiella sp. A23]MDV7339017.1 UDP-2,4-diacetamido-2,4,6-trideoxy-beta-L-altropyranose hydrolase [Terasakiella sp. A23]
MHDIYIHFEASKTLGLGHAVRCLNLAREYFANGYKINLLISEETANTIKNILPAKINIIAFNPATDDAEAISFSSQAIFIYDNYDLDATFSKQLRPYVGKILAIDDLANRKHDCDYLLDQTVGSTSERYKNLVPQNCKMLLGPDFALLDPSYALAREAQIQRLQSVAQNKKKVVITMGGTDPNNVTTLLLKHLPKVNNISSFEIIVGGSNPHLEDIKKSANQNPNKVNLHHNVSPLTQLMCQCDIAIGAGGVSALERCVLGLPSLMVEIADNQHYMINEIERAGAGINLGKPDQITETALTNAIQQITDENTFKKTSKAASALCNGKGVQRTIQTLTEC